MPRILLRAGKDPFEVLSPEVARGAFPKGVWGKNVGNLVFGDSMHKLLSVPGTEVVPNAFLSERPGVTPWYVDQINEQFDHFVIPLANAFRTSFMGNLERLTEVIEGLKIPVTVVGVGVAGGPRSLKNPLPRLKDDERPMVARFLTAVLDRSASIGVRGEHTQTFLASLGFGDEHVDVIGCPSLFQLGPGHSVHKRAEAISPDSHFTMNISPYVKRMAEASVRHAQKYPQMIYVPQDTATLDLMMYGTPHPDAGDPQMPVHIDHPLYVEDRMRFFTDSSTWFRFLATQDFSFGTRIHGNIAALVAGTPAHVIAHDSRTLELAQYHEIPHTTVPDLAEGFDAAELYEATDLTAFNAGHAARFDKFAAFLRKNGIAHVFEEGKANPEYETRLSALPFPDPVHTLSTTDPVARAEAYERIATVESFAHHHDWIKKFSPRVDFPVTPPPAPARRSVRRFAARVLNKAARVVGG